MNKSDFKIENDLWVVVLAAGKGKRMKAKIRNKVTYEVKGIPMITRTIKIIRDTGIENIIVVVGFAKESVLKLLDENIVTAEQKRRLGTGHGLKIGFTKVPKSAKYVLVLYGDDSFLYSGQLLRSQIDLHINTSSKLTFLSVEMDNPTGLGRILRDKNNNITGIVEEKDATDRQKKIKEINSACYIFDRAFLEKYINKIPRSSVTGEYYLPSLVDLAVNNKEKVQAYKIGNLKWRGVNTPEELSIAEEVFTI